MAVVNLREAGFGSENIAFAIVEPSAGQRETGTDRGAHMGRRSGEFLADAGEAAVSFVPFVGRNIVDSPVGRALREAVEDAGTSAGRLFGALTEGGVVGPSPSETPPDYVAAVVVMAENDRASEAAQILAAAGATQTMQEAG
jgi:hypothetical protein